MAKLLNLGYLEIPTRVQSRCLLPLLWRHYGFVLSVPEPLGVSACSVLPEAVSVREEYGLRYGPCFEISMQEHFEAHSASLLSSLSGMKFQDALAACMALQSRRHGIWLPRHGKQHCLPGPSPRLRSVDEHTCAHT